MKIQDKPFFISKCDPHVITSLFPSAKALYSISQCGGVNNWQTFCNSYHSDQTSISETISPEGEQVTAAHTT